MRILGSVDGGSFSDTGVELRLTHPRRLSFPAGAVFFLGGIDGDPFRMAESVGD